ncbi:hypothetical protein SLEP1_g4742 [Rubroshorea leprosula]|uniref:Uncharacterized protein n=1 Tax=Rubroshorea leprosula TaxID=152421 RepID=A0AAV5HTZ9_9ROSI|nr:hypothetical protein SLEP1_g4742 [Rubroshorea leprosula]
MTRASQAPPVVPLLIPPVAKFKIRTCQLLVTLDKYRNIVHALKAIKEAVEKGA